MKKWELDLVKILSADINEGNGAAILAATLLHLDSCPERKKPPIESSHNKKDKAQNNPEDHISKQLRLCQKHLENGDFNKASQVS